MRAERSGTTERRSETRIHGRAEDLASLVDAWDALAERSQLPYGSPAWMLGWWRHLAPPDARLLAVSVHDGDELIGLGAFHLAREARGSLHARLLAARYGGTPLGPLAAPGREPEVARALSEALATADPRPHAVHLDGIPIGMPWAAAIGRAWPRGDVLVQREARRPLPTIALVGTTFDEWLASKSSNFRQTLRRKRRQIEREGGRVRMSATVEEARRDLEAFERLHASRWDWRGGSGRLRPETGAFLAELAEELLPSGRFRLWSIDVDDATISSHLFVCGGGRANYWLGGFDDAYARYSPAMVTLLAAIEHAWSVGDTSVGLGAGRQAYKSRFTDDAQDLEWVALVPLRSLADPRGLAGVGPALATNAARNRLSPETKARLRRIVARSGPAEEPEG